MFRSKLNQNRYLYQIYLEMESGGIVKLIGAICKILPRHIFNMWGYVKEIKDNNYIVKMKKYDDVYMYVPLFQKDGIQRIIANSEDFFEFDILEDLKKYVSNNSVVMDIGANIGNHTVFFGKVCQVKSVYAFEPIKGTFDILKQNVNINNLSKVVKLFNCALGKAKGNASVVAFNESNIGGTTLKESKNGDIKVRSMDEIGITEKVDFIKIDVEGFECNVLEGAKALIEKDRPIVFIEIQEENIKWVKTFFRNKGYIMIREYEDSNFLFMWNKK